MNRRQFLAAGIASGMAAIPDDAAFAQRGEERGGWKNGDVEHLLPTVDHENILIKASFSRPPRAPWLGVGGKRFPGRQTDSEGRFWSFHAGGLAPAQRHQCTLADGSNNALCDPWPLKTFPRPTDAPASFRALMFTCAGGHDVTKRFLPIPMRIALLQRALSFEPDALETEQIGLRPR